MRITPDVRERFKAKVKKTRTCWIWTAAKNAEGYGVFGIGKKNYLAHRVAWSISQGPIPVGLNILHHCDEPACVRVHTDHLFSGTQQDNMNDMWLKGRGRPGRMQGEKNHQAKLTDQNVRRITKLYTAGGVTQYELAHQFGVTQKVVWNILNSAGWTHVTH